MSGFALKPTRPRHPCPSCRKLLDVDPEAGRFDCEHCGSTIEVQPTNGRVDDQGTQRAVRDLTTTAASDVEPTKTKWLWEGYIPLGAVTILGGRQGLGKSTLAIELAARVTRGALPGDLKGKKRSVLYATAEDALAPTLVPRLTLSKANLKRVHFPKATQQGTPTPIQLPGDIDELGYIAQEQDAALLIVDPLVSFLWGGGRLDAHRDQDVRQALSPLAAAAEEFDLAVLAIMHLNKATATSDALLRISGSVAFTAAPRSVLIFASDPADPEGAGPDRVLAQAKSNLGPRARSRECEIVTEDVETADGPAEQPRIQIGRASRHSASELVGAAANDPDERSARAQAQHFLKTELADGPVRVKALVEERSRDAGHAKKTLYRAKDDLGVESHQVREGDERYWVWSLPEAEGGGE